MFHQLKEKFFTSKMADDKVLSPKEIDLIRKSWTNLRSDIAGFKAFGADLFIRFFSQYPDYQRLFKSFKDVPICFSKRPMQEMRINKKLLAHGTYVMYTIGMLVDHLEDPITLEQMLKRLARNHYRRRVQITAFELLRECFIELLTMRVGPELMNRKTTIAWRKAFGYILAVLDREFGALEGDIQKCGSYYQLNNAHQVQRNNMLRTYVSMYRQQQQNQQQQLKSNRNSGTLLNVQNTRSTTPIGGGYGGGGGGFGRSLPPPAPPMRFTSTSLSSSSNQSCTTVNSNTSGKSGVKDFFSKRSFRIMFKPFKMVKKSWKSNNMDTNTTTTTTSTTITTPTIVNSNYI